MATLVSPGSLTSVTDNTITAVAPTGTVPFILLATAQDKLTPSNASATLTSAATAGELVLLSSQSDLLNSFGAPNFINVEGTPVNGSEMNEYGLMAAYSTLGVTNGTYVMRADIDLNALNGNIAPPSAPPPNGTYWFDSLSTQFGLFVWNAATQTFTNILPSNASGSGQLIVVSDITQIEGGLPLASLGKPGDYALVTAVSPIAVYAKVQTSSSDIFWQIVTKNVWETSVPVAVGTVANPTVTGNLIINGSNVSITGSLTAIVSSINTANIAVTAAAINNRLNLFPTTDSEDTIVIGESEVNANLGVPAGNYNTVTFSVSPHTSIPQWNSTDTTPRPTGSIWLNSTSPSNGANIALKQFNSVTGQWVSISTPIASNDAAINFTLDPTGGGINISVGSLYAQSPVTVIGSNIDTLGYSIFIRQSGPTSISGSETDAVFTTGSTFTLSSTSSGNANYSNPVTITLSGTDNTAFITAVNVSNVPFITASLNTAGDIVITHSQGGSFSMTDGTHTPLATAGFAYSTGATVDVSNWLPLIYQVSLSAPDADPANGTLWYYNDPTQFDIMINNGTNWVGYQTVTAQFEARGYNLTLTDPNGPIVSASQPIVQSDGTPLALGDLWINTGNLSSGLVISRYQSNFVSGGNVWVTIDSTDHVSSNGIIFADARWSVTGDVDPVTGILPTIKSLLTSSYLDFDAPQAVLYPRGTLLFNTRRSGLNVKIFKTNYFSNVNPLPGELNSWVSESGNNESGVAYFANNAQRQMVVNALNAAINSSSAIADQTNAFNLMSCPGYPELNSTLVTINDNIQQTAFIVGDTPMTLAADTNDINNWINNTAGSDIDNASGLVTHDDYLGIYYPAGLTTDLSGNQIVVPSAHAALRTIINSDFQSFPWFAPAGVRRGIVDNVTSIGYLDESGDFNTTSVNQGLRDVLYVGGVNPITNLPGNGITIYGQKTTSNTGSELNRINVARLVVYIRTQLNLIAQQYIFEPNDAITRQNIAYQMTQFLTGISVQRALNDFLVVCDTSNNSPATIDANIMYVDVAIEPISALEFIYIPITVENTGSIAASTTL